VRPLDATRDAFLELLGRKPAETFPSLERYDQISGVFGNSPAAMATALGFPVASKGGNAKVRATVRRRYERYENWRKGTSKEKRNPAKADHSALREAAKNKIRAEREEERKRNPRTLEKLLEEARQRGITVTRYHGGVRISESESYRKVDDVYVAPDLLDELGVLADAAAGKWGNCAIGLAEAWGFAWLGLDGVQWITLEDGRAVDTLKLRIGL
jgi:hypothetical protein